MKKLKKKYLLFIITNQPDVFRKKNSKKNVLEINNYLKKNYQSKKYILVIVKMISVNLENQILECLKKHQKNIN